MSNVAYYWNGAGWTKVDTPAGAAGAQGSTGPAGGTRTLCGACHFRNSEPGQPSGAIWYADHFAATALNADPNPVLSLTSGSEWQVMRNTSAVIIHAMLAITSGSPITARSFFDIQVYRSGSDYDTLARASWKRGDDGLSQVGMVLAPALGTRIRIQVYLNGSGNYGYIVDVVAALAP